MARLNAGFKTATAAIQKFGWNGSTYRAHESGQNNFNEKTAIAYSQAFNTTVEWLLLGIEADKFKINEGSFERIENINAYNHTPVIIWQNINRLVTVINNDPNPQLVKLLIDHAMIYERLLTNKL